MEHVAPDLTRPRNPIPVESQVSDPSSKPRRKRGRRVFYVFLGVSYLAFAGLQLDEALTSHLKPLAYLISGILFLFVGVFWLARTRGQ